MCIFKDEEQNKERQKLTISVIKKHLNKVIKKVVQKKNRKF